VPVVITPANSDSDLESVRKLFCAYAESLPFSLEIAPYGPDLDGQIVFFERQL
jgi:hypothetical protein